MPHDVPENRFAADLHHRLGAHSGLFGEPRPFSSGKNDNFHINAHFMHTGSGTGVMKRPPDVR